MTFIVWVLALFSYLPVLKLGLDLSDQLGAPLFLISLLILVFSWALSGPATAAILSVLSVLLAFYFSLSAKEPAIFLQLVITAFLFILMSYYLYKIQNKTNDKKISREKLAEEIYLAQEEIQKKAVLKKALEEKISRILDLQRFSKELKGEAGLHDVARRIVKEAHDVLEKADECALYLVNEAKQELSLIASTRSKGEVVKEKEGSIFDRWTMKRSQPIMIEDTQNDFRFPKETAPDGERLRSICVSPLITENRVLGVVRASSSKPGVFTADDLRLLDIFSGLGAVTIRNILLYEKMEELAIRDSLTGLYLNRYFQERLAEEIRRAQFNKVFFSVILLDIDYFKRYNDEYGHPAGDLVLKHIAGILLKCLDPGDLVARYGGEEFVVFLPNKDKKEAAKVAEKIRSEIDKNKFFVRRAEHHVTASLGVTTFPQGGRTKDELIWTADKNLYAAKASGRNRVCSNI